MSAQQPDHEANQVIDLWGEDDLDTQQTQLMPSQEDTVQQRTSDQLTTDSPLPLQHLHDLVTTIARTIVKELADTLETEFTEKLKLNNLEVLQQAMDQ